MDDLISRSSLLAGIEELKQSPWFKRGKLEDTDTDVDFNRGLQHCGYLERKEAIDVIIELCIEKEPTVETQPVKHAKGLYRIQKDGTTVGQHGVRYCSECGYVIFTKTDVYCASCGARMDGESE